MNRLMYVIVERETQVPPKVRGARTLPVYTTRGRAEHALMTHRFPKENYEVVTYGPVNVEEFLDD